jgi:membrane fusion protein, multidrug efflux system
MANNWDSSTASPDVAVTSDAGRRKRLRWLLFASLAIILILAAIVVWRLTSMSRDAQQTRSRLAAATQPVGVAKASTHDIRVILNEIGTVAPLATVTVQTQLSGVLMQVGFKEGQLVHKGDFLAQIDPRPYQILLEQYQAQLLKDQSALRQAQTDLERYRELLQRDSIAKQTVDDQLWLVQQDEGTVRVDQAQIDNQRLNLAYCRIVSPVDGRVGLRLVDVGNYVQANGGSGIVVVTQLHPISAVFTVPEDSVPAVIEQFRTAGPLKATAFDRANVTALATGTLSAIDTQIDVTTGTVKMRSLFDNADNSLYPQQFVNIQLLVKVQHDAIVVPKTAIQNGSGGTFVYMLSDDNTVSVRPVTLGTQDGEFVAITTGVAVGDRVVVDGADQLRAGAKAAVRGDAPSATGGGAAPPPADAGQKPRGQGRRSPQAGQGQPPQAQGDAQPAHRRDPAAK